MDEIQISLASKEDVMDIYKLIKELAIYEKAENEVKNTPDQLIKDGFGENPLFFCLLARYRGEVLGISFFYYRYSTWKGKTLYLEDLIVSEKYRRKGVGKKLFESTMEEAKNRECNQMSWQVLDWNTPAIDFYKNYEVDVDDEWLNMKLKIQ